MKELVYAPRGIALAVEPSAIGMHFPLVDSAILTAKPYEECEGHAVVCISGPLTAKESWCWDSYDAIKGRVAAALASGNADVILKIDSPGGDANGCLELARELRAMSIAANKPLIAFADGMACSAAYAIACAASKIYCNAMAFLGSIGVVDARVDVTAQDAAMGLRFAFIASGARKTDGNPHVPMAKEELAAKQVQVDGLAELFFDLVTELRGLPRERIVALQAGTLFGQAAVDAGLADKVLTWSELVSAKSQSGEEGDKQMAGKGVTKYLAEIADGEDKEEASKAKKALRALLAEDGGDDEKKEPEKKEEAKAASAESEPEKKDSEKMQVAAAAAAHTPAVTALARELHQLKAERAAEKDALEREKILATRPDLDAKVVTALAAVATKDLAAVLETFPRIPNAAAAAQVTGTRGAEQGTGGYNPLPAEEAHAIKMAMGRASNPVEHGLKGNELTLGFLTPEQAKARLQALNGGK